MGGMRISGDFDKDGNGTNIHMTDQTDNEHLNLEDTDLDDFLDEWGGRNTDLNVSDNDDGTEHVTIYTTDDSDDSDD